MIGYNFEILKRHYDSMEFVPGKRYLMRTLFETYNYPEGFPEEKTFRDELYRLKPLFVANAPKDSEILIDLDIRFDIYNTESFEFAKNYVIDIIRIVEKIIEVRDFKIRFSGRGIHVVINTPVLEDAIRKSQTRGLNLSRDPRSILMKYIIREIELENPKLLDGVVDKTTSSSNKVFRTLYSINDKSFLPVVDFRVDDEINIDTITSQLIEPRKFKVKLKKDLHIRVGERYAYTDSAIVDEYEFLRIITKFNYYLDTFEIL